MTDHEAETVARATLWLDTSNETTTRRAECLDECATLSFERPSEPEPATTFAHDARVAETATLHRSGIFAAFNEQATATFASTLLGPAAGVPTRRRAVILRIATHGLALALGVAGGSMMMQAPRIQPTARVPAATAPARQSAPQAVEPPSATHAATVTPAAIEAAATLSSAVDALAGGDYSTAHASYAALAQARPNDAALASVAAILESRLRARCTESERTEGRCHRE